MALFPRYVNIGVDEVVERLLKPLQTPGDLDVENDGRLAKSSKTNLLNGKEVF